MDQEKGTGAAQQLKQTNEKSEFDKLMETNHQLKTQLNKYKKALEMANKNIDDLNHKKEKYKNNLAVANEEIENLKIQLKNKDDDLKKSKGKNEQLKDYIRSVQSQQNDGLKIESVASVVEPKASSTNNLKTPLDQKKRPFNNDGSPTSLKRGNGKRKFKERFETSCALVDETPHDIERRKNKVEMARIQKDILKKDYRFCGSETESEGEKQVLYCLKCSKSFDSKKLLRQHMEIHLNRKIGEDPEVLPLFNCSLCKTSRSFHNAAGIYAHIQSKHTSQNVMKCSFRNCFHQVKESNKQDLLSHIRSKHTQEKLFRCNECSKDFSTYTALKDHEKKHASGKQCKNCLRFYTLDNCFFCKKKK